MCLPLNLLLPHAMADVTSIPTELWQDIIVEACTDGGYTGRSLALTNKFFHAQSLSSRFYSLAFSSLRRIETFLSCLESQPAECDPMIQHLYLSFFQEPVADVPIENAWELLSPAQLREEEQLRSIRKREWDVRFSLSMRRLFALAGPRLRTLCILGGTHMYLPHFPFDPLPALRELTLLRAHRIFIPEKSLQNPDPDQPAQSPFKFPALQRLHCIGTPDFSPSNILFDVANHAPLSLTHLRVSGLEAVHRHIDRFSARLARCFDVPPNLHSTTFIPSGTRTSHLTSSDRPRRSVLTAGCI